MALPKPTPSAAPLNEAASVPPDGEIALINVEASAVIYQGMTELQRQELSSAGRLEKLRTLGKSIKACYRKGLVDGAWKNPESMANVLGERVWLVKKALALDGRPDHLSSGKYKMLARLAGKCGVPATDFLPDPGTEEQHTIQGVVRIFRQERNRLGEKLTPGDFREEEFPFIQSLIEVTAAVDYPVLESKTDHVRWLGQRSENHGHTQPFAAWEEGRFQRVLTGVTDWLFYRELHDEFVPKLYRIARRIQETSQGTPLAERATSLTCVWVQVVEFLKAFRESKNDVAQVAAAMELGSPKRVKEQLLQIGLTVEQLAHPLAELGRLLMQSTRYRLYVIELLSWKEVDSAGSTILTAPEARP